MTSLIWGGIYLAHQGVVSHRRDKQRTKNYQRWEDLREEYDEQKKITRETRSLDIQRTGTGSYFDQDNGPRDMLTLRDQQEANDARMSWRPQESWEAAPVQNTQYKDDIQRATTTPRAASIAGPSQHEPFHRSSTVPSAYWAGRGEIRPQKTGVTWDEGLPPPLRVSRRSYDAQEHNPSQDSIRSQMAQMESSPYGSYQGSPYAGNSQHSSRNSSQVRPSAMHIATAPAATSYDVEPIQSHVPGGRMAELIERGY